MSGISLSNFRVYNLQKEYFNLSNILSNYQKHIDRCCDGNLITNSERNSYMKVVTDLLRQTNSLYNLNMMDIHHYDTDSSDDPSDLQIIPGVTEPIMDDYIDLLNFCKILDFKDDDNQSEIDIINPFEDIYTTLLNKISKKIGFWNVLDALTVVVGQQYEKLYGKDSIDMINLYNKVFIPLNFKINKINKKETIFFRKIDLYDDLLLDNTAEICISLEKNGEYLVMCGYFENDPLNILVRTSQICYNFIYQKKKNIETYVLKQNVNEKFVKSYIRNSKLCYFIIFNENGYYKKLRSDYDEYINLTKLSFMNLMKEFVKDSGGGRKSSVSIRHMYNIIRLLLLGSEDNINIAGLLYGISKEKKPGSEFSISDIIYKNLNHNSQIKLRKSSINIKNELEKIKSMSLEDIDFKKQISVCKNMPYIAKKASLDKIEEMKSSGNDYHKQLLYVKTLLNFPWPSAEDDTFFEDIGKDDKRSTKFLDGIIENLDSKVYGHIECKESIRDLIGKWISKPSSSGSAIGLVGPPGVGKTLIAKAIGDSLNIPFVQITLGGQNDGELLHGHGYTYSGAQPGMVIKKMVEAGSSRCIMYFDELDKACKKHDSNEIYNILIHMIDPNTNEEFQDRFFQEISFPLRKVLFIFSYNDSSSIDKILLDRIEEIEVKPFKLQDKMVIVDKFILKEMSELVGFEYGSIKFNEEDTEFIIEQYTYEPGVRELKRKFEKIFLKLNIDKIYKNNIFKRIKHLSKNKPVYIDRDRIREYLGKNNMHIQTIHEQDLVGVISGLYATDAGKGGVLPIQIFNNYTDGDDKFSLKLTGSQKRVMRESVMSAFTTAMHLLKEDIRNDIIEKNPHGFHIHTPSGAVPKDGPSAGCAFATAFISRIVNKKIKHDIGMTGEIELTGKITKIGGLQYKLTGAKKAGVKLVFVPSENKEDLENIKNEYQDIFEDGFEVVLVDSIVDILERAIIDFDPFVLNN